MVIEGSVRPLPHETVRRLIVPLAVAFVALDVTALALLGPVAPTDTSADLARLYGDRSSVVVISRVVHCFALSLGLAFVGLIAGELRSREGGGGTLTRLLYGGVVALVPIEVVRNVMFTALALRYDDFGTVAVPMHLVAVLLGPSIAVPVTTAMVALAALMRSRLVAMVALLWAVSVVRLATMNAFLWYAGLTALVGLLAVVITLALRLSRPADETANTEFAR